MEKYMTHRVKIYSLISAIVLVSQTFAGFSVLKTLSAVALGLAAFIEYKRAKNKPESD